MIMVSDCEKVTALRPGGAGLRCPFRSVSLTHRDQFRDPALVGAPLFHPLTPFAASTVYRTGRRGPPGLIAEDEVPKMKREEEKNMRTAYATQHRPGGSQFAFRSKLVGLLNGCLNGDAFVGRANGLAGAGCGTEAHRGGRQMVGRRLADLQFDSVRCFRFWAREGILCRL